MLFRLHEHWLREALPARGWLLYLLTSEVFRHFDICIPLSSFIIFPLYYLCIGFCTVVQKCGRLLNWINQPLA